MPCSCNRKCKSKNWLQAADKEMDKKGTEGKFTAKAKRAGKSVSVYSKEVVNRLKGKKNTAAQATLLKQAVFAKNTQKFRKNKKKN